MKPLTKDKYLTPDEYQYLIRVSGDKSRNSILIRVALETGARASELIGLKNTDLDHEERTLHIRAKKGSNDRYFPLSMDLYRKINSLPVSEDGRYFPFGYNRLRAIWHDYRPCNKTFHSARHSFAVRLYKKTKDIKFVQICLGHKNPQTTAVYLDFFYSSEEMRRLLCE